MVAVTVALTIFAGPLYQLCASIGEALQDEVVLVDSGEGAAP
jgi:multicomponent Na+:H+ antiporter subunit D